MLWSFLKALDLRIVLAAITVVLLFALGWSVYWNLESAAERKGLEEALEVLDEKIETEKKSNKLQIDSLKREITLKEERFDRLVKDQTSLKNRIKINQSITNERTAKINRITNSDSLAALLTKRYR